VARNLGAVEFSDGHRLYMIFDGTVDIAQRPLFDSPDAAWSWYADGKQIDFPEPLEASNSEEPVTVVKDLAYVDDPVRRDLFAFESRASRHARWLTGPRSESERQAEIGAEIRDEWLRHGEWG